MMFVNNKETSLVETDHKPCTPSQGGCGGSRRGRGGRGGARGGEAPLSGSDQKDRKESIYDTCKRKCHFIKDCFENSEKAQAECKKMYGKDYVKRFNLNPKKFKEKKEDVQNGIRYLSLIVKCASAHMAKQYGWIYDIGADFHIPNTADQLFHIE